MAVRVPEVGHEERNVDVTVIGAGPTGLTTALLASKLGLSVCIVDQAEGPLPVGRADALNARTQQLLSTIDVLPTLLPKGLKCNTSSTFKDGKFASRQSQWWTSLQNTQFKEFLMIGQPEVERALIQKMDFPVLYDTTVESVKENADYALTRCGNLTIKSKYIVAANGAHSFVRKQLQINFEGEKAKMRWAVLDTFLDTDFPTCDEIISLELNGKSRVAWIPRERGLARFYVLLDGEVNQQRAEESIREHMAPFRVEFAKTEWFSTFDVQERVAETFISKTNGRILLAGDAAHVHSVNGGQGLNTGISDGFALAWRLNMACRGFGPAALQSYDAERRATARGVVDVAAKLVRSTMRTSEDYVRIVERNAANITGMGITYEPTTAFVVAGQSGSFVAGARCPDFPLTQPGSGSKEQDTFFYDLFQYGRFVVLLPAGMQIETRDPLIITWRTERNEQGYFNIMAGDDGKVVLKTEFDLGGGAVVVRPDLYVGYAGSEPKAYLRGIFA